MQFNPAAASWPLFRDATLAAEAAGFGAVWVLDHLAGVSMRGSGMLECFACLGALATTTTTIGLGTLVANVWNREPGVLAVAAASVCEIADRPAPARARRRHVADEQVRRRATRRRSHHRSHARRASLAGAHDARTDRHDVRSGPAGAVRDVPTPPPSSDDVARREQCAIWRRWPAQRAGGINVWWGHPRRDEFLAAADAAHVDGSPFLRTVYEWWDDDLLDAQHPARLEMEAARDRSSDPRRHRRT